MARHLVTERFAIGKRRACCLPRATRPAVRRAISLILNSEREKAIYVEDLALHNERRWEPQTQVAHFENHELLRQLVERKAYFCVNKGGSVVYRYLDEWSIAFMVTINSRELERENPAMNRLFRHFCRINLPQHSIESTQVLLHTYLRGALGWNALNAKQTGMLEDVAELATKTFVHAKELAPLSFELSDLLYSTSRILTLGNTSCFKEYGWHGLGNLCLVELRYAFCDACPSRLAREEIAAALQASCADKFGRNLPPNTGDSVVEIDLDTALARTPKSQAWMKQLVRVMATHGSNKERHVVIRGVEEPEIYSILLSVCRMRQYEIVDMREHDKSTPSMLACVRKAMKMASVESRHTVLIVHLEHILSSASVGAAVSNLVMHGALDVDDRASFSRDFGGTTELLFDTTVASLTDAVRKAVGRNLLVVLCLSEDEKGDTVAKALRSRTTTICAKHLTIKDVFSGSTERAPALNRETLIALRKLCESCEANPGSVLAIERTASNMCSQARERVDAQRLKLEKTLNGMVRVTEFTQKINQELLESTEAVEKAGELLKIKLNSERSLQESITAKQVDLHRVGTVQMESIAQKEAPLLALRAATTSKIDAYADSVRSTNVAAIVAHLLKNAYPNDTRVVLGFVVS